MNSCLFCKIISREAPAHIIDEDEDVIVFLSLENHPLIVPKKHFVDIHSLDAQCAGAVMIEAVKISQALKAATKCNGINLVQANGAAAGQDVFHFHLHVKPRWKNDGVVLGWNTNTESEAKRQELAERLTKAISNQPR